MAQKCILILVDGMRPDAQALCGHPFCKEFLESGAVELAGRSVMPSVTLPCHISLFHSVPPERHGTVTNTYVPQVRPVRSLVEVLHSAGKTTAMFTNWEQLRDISVPGNMSFTYYMDYHVFDNSDALLTDALLEMLPRMKPDFVFLYLGLTDCAGHDHGWMSPEYLETLKGAWECIRRVSEAAADEYDLVVTADHGGHERSHGTDREEDLSIPFFLRTVDGRTVRPGVTGGRLTDLAPTVCALMGVAPDRDWEGASLI